MLLPKVQRGLQATMCEHQSGPHAQMPLRLLKYNTAYRSRSFEARPQALPSRCQYRLHTTVRIPRTARPAFAGYCQNPELGAQNLYMAPCALARLPAKGRLKSTETRSWGFVLQPCIVPGTKELRSLPGTLRFAEWPHLQRAFCKPTW